VTQYIEIDGRLPDSESMGLALVGYGHFTYMQVRSHAVRGLDLHLERLERGTRELFGSGLDHDRIRRYVHRALRRTSGDASVRVQIIPEDPSMWMSGANVGTRAMVLVRPPADPNDTPQRLRSVEYERPLPHIKHLDTMGLIHQTRLARQAGYDDALFTDGAGHVSEATVANIVFSDEEEGAFVWPDTPALPGIMRELLRRGMTRLSVPVRDRSVHRSELLNYNSAFLTNSINDAQPVASVDDIPFTVREPVRALLRRCHESNNWQTI
jgi:branched-subunit amino acid aminotransferase/4-amino-4-deoxychorismate lyase